MAVTETTRLASQGAVPAATQRVSLIFAWADALRAIALAEGQTLTVGRSEPAHVTIEDRSLSRTHARLSLRGGRVHVADAGSTNGTKLNGQPIVEAFVGEGDVVVLGSVELRVSGGVGSLPPPRVQLSHAAWMQRVEEECARARFTQRGFCVVAVRHGDDEVPSLPAALRPIDCACAYAPGMKLVLLPESGAAEVAALAAGLRAGAARPPALGCVAFPEHGATSEQLLSAAVESVRRAEPNAAVTRARAAAADGETDEAPIVASASMRRLYELVARAARAQLPVLVLGETGSGKELVARALHAQGPRARAPFRALNCATVPVTLVESTLFGHERGAFSGADRQQPGIFEQAQGGTVFLDEVGELTAQAQAALLRVLEQKRLVRVGGSREIAVDVRVVAATHRDLTTMVAAGSFREDLLFRLDALTLRVPPLRERRDEIPLLAERFLARARSHWGSRARSFAPDALEALVDFPFPGNVRQLRNAVERAAALCMGERIELEDLPEAFWTEPAPTQQPSSAASAAPPPHAPASCEGAPASLTEQVRAFEVGLIREALAHARGNQALAARMLGIPRRTLAHKVHGYGLLAGGPVDTAGHGSTR